MLGATKLYTGIKRQKSSHTSYIANLCWVQQNYKTIIPKVTLIIILLKVFLLKCEPLVQLFMGGNR